MKFSTADWLAAIFFVTLLLLPLWLPHAPMFVQVTIAHSRHLGRSLFCGLRLAVVAIAIIVACVLLVFGIGR